MGDLRRLPNAYGDYHRHVLVIREVAMGELGAWVEVANRGDDAWPMTVDEVADLCLRGRRTNLLALRDGEPVGAAWCGHTPDRADPIVGQGAAFVPPELRRQGVGGRL